VYTVSGCAGARPWPRPWASPAATVAECDGGATLQRGAAASLGGGGDAELGVGGGGNPDASATSKAAVGGLSEKD
jgi:hypothetical protein